MGVRIPNTRVNEAQPVFTIDPATGLPSSGGGGSGGDVNLIEIVGTAVSVGSGVNGAGVQRVTLATDDAASAALVAMQNATGPVLAPSAATPVSGTTASAMTGTTSTQVLAAAGASLRNYVTTIIVSNSHATVSTDVQILDGNGGTLLATIPAAAVYGGAAISLPVPLRGTANTRMDAKNVTTGSSTNVTLIGYTGA